MKNNIKNPYKFVKEISDFIALYDNYISALLGVRWCCPVCL